MAPTADDATAQVSGRRKLWQPTEGDLPGMRQRRPDAAKAAANGDAVNVPTSFATAASTTTRILIIDKYGVYRKGMRSLIEARVPCAKVFEASDISAALSSFASADTFDLVLIDFTEIGGRSRRLLQQSLNSSPTTRFAVLSTSRARADVIGSLVAGFHGFMLKLQTDEEIIGAITDLIAGRIYVPPWLAEGADERSKCGSSPGIRDDAPALTPRQGEVLALLALGLSNKEIAHELHISEGTTKIHTAALLRALGARNRTEAVFKAVNGGVSRGRHDVGGATSVGQPPEAAHAAPVFASSQRLWHA